MILGALGLLVHNELESSQAGRQARQQLTRVQEAVLAQEAAPADSEHVNPYDQAAVEESREMTVKEVGGYDCIGFLSIPKLELELPVMAQWSYPRLRIAPCRHMGSTKSDDLVIAAHNYSTHFGHLWDLEAGDLVQFVDMDGLANTYAVCSVGIIPPDGVEQVQDPALDLVLYTCTYGGKRRVMVGCQRAE